MWLGRRRHAGGERSGVRGFISGRWHHWQTVAHRWSRYQVRCQGPAGEQVHKMDRAVWGQTKAWNRVNTNALSLILCFSSHTSFFLLRRGEGLFWRRQHLSVNVSRASTKSIYFNSHSHYKPKTAFCSTEPEGACVMNQTEDFIFLYVRRRKIIKHDRV